MSIYLVTLIWGTSLTSMFSALTSRRPLIICNTIVCWIISKLKIWITLFYVSNCHIFLHENFVLKFVTMSALLLSVTQMYFRVRYLDHSFLLLLWAPILLTILMCLCPSSMRMMLQLLSAWFGTIPVQFPSMNEHLYLVFYRMRRSVRNSTSVVLKLIFLKWALSKSLLMTYNPSWHTKLMWNAQLSNILSLASQSLHLIRLKICISTKELIDVYHES